MVLDLGRRGLGFGLASVFVAFAIASGCTDAEVNNSPPDGSIGPSPTSEGGTQDGPDSGPRADGVIRELSYQQLTAKAEHAPASARIQLSGNGQRVAFSTRDGAGINKIWVVDAAGGEPVLLDTTAATGNHSIVAISDDGNTIASTDGKEVRVTSNTGASKGKLTFAAGELSNIGVNATGTEVYFVSRRDEAFPPPSNAPVERGLYKFAPLAAGGDVTSITPLVTASDVAPLVGKTVDKVFPFATCGGSGPGYNGLAYSADGSKMFVGVQVEDAMLVISTSNGGPTGAKVVVPAPTLGFKNVTGIATNKDGSKLAVILNNDSQPGGELDVMNGDGTGKQKIADIPAGCSNPLAISDDGKVVGVGNTAMVYPTDGTDPWPVQVATGANADGWFHLGEPDGAESRDMVMSRDGKRFAFLNSEGNGKPRHIGIAELDASSLGAVPTVSAPKMSPTKITVDTATVAQPRASLSAKVSGTSPRVGGVIMNKGIREGGIVSASLPLLDDGKNLDTTAGDGTYTSSAGAYANAGAVVGPRVIRIKAEVKAAATDKRSAHSVDFPTSVE